MWKKILLSYPPKMGPLQQPPNHLKAQLVLIIYIYIIPRYYIINILCFQKVPNLHKFTIKPEEGCPRLATMRFPARTLERLQSPYGVSGSL